MIAGRGNATGEIVEWMRFVFAGVRANEAPPVTFTPQQLKSVQVTVLLILGECEPWNICRRARQSKCPNLRNLGAV